LATIDGGVVEHRTTDGAPSRSELVSERLGQCRLSQSRTTGEQHASGNAIGGVGDFRCATQDVYGAVVTDEVSECGRRDDAT
jgi:hypothetical protein